MVTYNMSFAFVHFHLGIGDLIYGVGAIRFLATKFKEVRVVCWRKNHIIFDSIFNDTKNIIPVLTDNGSFHFYNYEESAGCALFLGGLYNVFKHSRIEDTAADYPYSMYDDLEIPRSIMKDYFRVPKYKELWEYIPDRFIFIHENSTEGHVDIFSKLKTNLKISFYFCSCVW